MEVRRIRLKAAIRMFISIRWRSTAIRSVWETTGSSSATPTSTTRDPPSLTIATLVLKP